MSDHRSAQPTCQEYKNLAAQARVGGMLSSKAGIVDMHIGDGKSGLSMLFEINKLFEEYIGILCKSLSFKNRIKCFLQDKRNYLLKNKDRKYINLKPDIVFEKEEKILIIDTKWKAIINHERLNYNISDIIGIKSVSNHCRVYG